MSRMTNSQAGAGGRSLPATPFSQQRMVSLDFQLKSLRPTAPSPVAPEDDDVGLPRAPPILTSLDKSSSLPAPRTSSFTTAPPSPTGARPGNYPGGSKALLRGGSAGAPNPRVAMSGVSFPGGTLSLGSAGSTPLGRCPRILSPDSKFDPFCGAGPSASLPTGGGQGPGLSRTVSLPAAHVSPSLGQGGIGGLLPLRSPLPAAHGGGEGSVGLRATKSMRLPPGAALFGAPRPAALGGDRVAGGAGPGRAASGPTQVPPAELCPGPGPLPPLPSGRPPLPLLRTRSEPVGQALTVNPSPTTTGPSLFALTSLHAQSPSPHPGSHEASPLPASSSAALAEALQLANALPGLPAEKGGEDLREPAARPLGPLPESTVAAWVFAEPLPALPESTMASVVHDEGRRGGTAAAGPMGSHASALSQALGSLTLSPDNQGAFPLRRAAAAERESSLSPQPQIGSLASRLLAKAQIPPQDFPLEPSPPTKAGRSLTMDRGSSEELPDGSKAAAEPGQGCPAAPPAEGLIRSRSRSLSLDFDRVASWPSNEVILMEEEPTVAAAGGAQAQGPGLASELVFGGIGGLEPLPESEGPSEAEGSGGATAGSTPVAPFEGPAAASGTFDQQGYESDTESQPGGGMAAGHRQGGRTRAAGTGTGAGAGPDSVMPSPFVPAPAPNAPFTVPDLGEAEGPLRSPTARPGRPPPLRLLDDDESDDGRGRPLGRHGRGRSDSFEDAIAELAGFHLGFGQEAAEGEVGAEMGDASGGVGVGGGGAPGAPNVQANPAEAPSPQPPAKPKPTSGTRVATGASPPPPGAAATSPGGTRVAGSGCRSFPCRRLMNALANAFQALAVREGCARRFAPLSLTENDEEVEVLASVGHLKAAAGGGASWDSVPSTPAGGLALGSSLYGLQGSQESLEGMEEPACPLGQGPGLTVEVKGRNLVITCPGCPGPAATPASPSLGDALPPLVRNVRLPSSVDPSKVSVDWAADDVLRVVIRKDGMGEGGGCKADGDEDEDSDL